MPGEPKFSVSQVTTYHLSFQEDLSIYRQAGAGGIGIWEFKLPERQDARSLDQLEFGGAVHLADWRQPTRGGADQALPEEGVMDLPALLGALEAGGFDGWHDLEIYSDDGTFGDDYPDSLWKLDPLTLIRRAKDKDSCVSSRRGSSPAAPRPDLTSRCRPDARHRPDPSDVQRHRADGPAGGLT